MRQVGVSDGDGAHSSRHERKHRIVSSRECLSLGSRRLMFAFWRVLEHPLQVYVKIPVEKRRFKIL